MFQLSLKVRMVSFFEFILAGFCTDLFPDGKRSSPSLLARQLRLRLVADDDSGVPRNLHNIVVSIHAIATFQALHDYLRPRVAGLLGSGSAARLSSMAAGMSGMLAALSSAHASGSSGTSLPAPAPVSAPIPSTSSAEAHSPSASAPIARRRSQRLSARRNSTGSDAVPSPAPTFPAPGAITDGIADSVAQAPIEPPLSEAAAAALESELHAAEFSDDEIDAEVFDDEDADPDTSISDKTVSLAVAEGNLRIL